MHRYLDKMKQKLIGYRILHIEGINNIPNLEKSINDYLSEGWTLKGATINATVDKTHKYIQTMVKYSGESVYPRICKYKLYTCCGYTSRFENDVITAANNEWTLYGDMFYAVDKNHMEHYSQALVLYEEKGPNENV